jgi:tryptophan 2,3-dioxygenase
MICSDFISASSDFMTVTERQIWQYRETEILIYEKTLSRIHLHIFTNDHEVHSAVQKF